jgi:hypothetical protein
MSQLTVTHPKLLSAAACALGLWTNVSNSLPTSIPLVRLGPKLGAIPPKPIRLTHFSGSGNQATHKMLRRLLPRRLGIGGRIGRRVSKALLHFLLKSRDVGDGFIGRRLPAIVQRHRPTRAARPPPLASAGSAPAAANPKTNMSPARRRTWFGAPVGVTERCAPHSKRSGCSLTMRAYSGWNWNQPENALPTIL